MSKSLGTLRDLVGNGVNSDLLSAYRLVKKSRGPDFEGLGPLDALKRPWPKMPEVPVSGLIVELRPHWNLVHVIKRVIKHLRIPVTLIYGRLNKSQVEGSRALQKEAELGNLRLIELDLENVNRQQYTALFLSEELWFACVPATQILVFQTDSTLCRRTPNSLETFKDLDYVGSFMPNPRPSGLHIDGGNGGLSLRNHRRSIEAIRAGRPKEWPSPEDDYFGSHVQLVGGLVADEDTAKRFGSQVVFERRSFGVHNPGGLRPWDFVRLVAYCPDSIRCHRGKILGRPVESYLRPFIGLRRF